jgi:hypothetical protein
MRGHIRIAFASIAALAACGVNKTPQPAPDATFASCVPNLDGKIDFSELPIALGATVAFYDSTNAAVDLTGKTVDGQQVWDMSAEPAAADTVVHLGPTALDTQWFVSAFPNGQFLVDAGSGLVGIYHEDATALWLDGTASTMPAPAAGKTLIVYDQAVAMLRFPIQDGDAYTTSAPLTSANATIDGLPFNGSDEIDVDITGSGHLDVPQVEFAPVLRAHTHVTRTASSGGATISTRTTAFLFECFGEVAHADSKPDETAPDFTTAATLRRFALGQ